MESGFQAAFLPDTGYFNFEIPVGPASSDFNDFTPAAFDPALMYEYVPASSTSQNMSMPPYSGSYPSQSAMANMNNQIPEYSALPSFTSANFANTRDLVDAASVSLINTEPSGGLPREWTNFSQSAIDHTANHALSLSQQYYSTVSPITTPIETPGMIPPPLSFITPQQMPSHSGIAPPSHAANSGVSTANSGPALRQARNAQVFPQSVTSSTSTHQRRQHRPNALAPTASTPASGSQRSRSNVPPSRARARPTSMTASTNHHNTQSAHAPASHGTRNHESTTIGLNRQPATAASHHRSSQSTQYSSSYDRVAERNAHWSALLRNIPPSEFRALYEQSLAHGQDLCPHRKILDTPKESRPEPKETDELTLNMECKICMDQLVDTVLLPCGHAILCRWCADQHIPSLSGYPQGKANCPMCREPVKQKYRIYFP
ncbi:hypothetical protein BJX70DRAFT_399986 [Aspergillus crustosus]